MFQIQSRHVDVGNPVGKNKIKKKVRAAAFAVLWSTRSVRSRDELRISHDEICQGWGQDCNRVVGQAHSAAGLPWIGPCRGTSDVSLVLYTLVICDRSDGDEEPPRPR